MGIEKGINTLYSAVISYRGPYIIFVLPYDDDGPLVPGAVPHSQLPRAPPDDLGEVPVRLEVGGERVDLRPEEAEVAVHARLVPVQGLLKALGGALHQKTKEVFLKKTLTAL